MEKDELKAQLDAILEGDAEVKADVALIEVFKTLTAERDEARKASEQAVEALDARDKALTHIVTALGTVVEEGGSVSPDDAIKIVDDYVEKSGRKLSAKTLDVLSGVAASMEEARVKLHDLIDAEKRTDDEEKTEKPADTEQKADEGTGAYDDGVDPEAEETAKSLRGELGDLRNLAEQILGDSKPEDQ